MPRTTASPADACADKAADAVIDFIQNKMDCTLERRTWLLDLTDVIGLQLDGPIEDALDDSYQEGFEDGEDAAE